MVLSRISRVPCRLRVFASAANCKFLLQVLEILDETETREKKLTVRVGKGALRLAVRRADDESESEEEGKRRKRNKTAVIFRLGIHRS